MSMMGTKLSVGRLRVTKAVSPGESGYIRSMRLQTEHLAKIMDNFVKGIKNVSAQAIYVGMEEILKRSQELVPVDTGRLKRSAFREIRAGADGPYAVMGYAKHGNPHYAAFVHEMLHIPHAKGKSAKFLERAVQERLMAFRRRVIKYIQDQMGYEY